MEFGICFDGGVVCWDSYCCWDLDFFNIVLLKRSLDV